MNPISNILVIVDPTAEAYPSIANAALLAAAFKARMELYVCDTKAARQVRLAASARKQPQASATVSLKGLLESLAAPLRLKGIDVTTEVDYGDPLHEALIDKARRTSADLVVKDTHHHSLLRRTFLTNTDWHLIRACPVPLLLTRQSTWATPPRILAALDPGHMNDKPALLDQRILEYASCFAKRLGGELHALHAFVPVSVIAAAVGSEPPSALAISAEEIEREQQAKVQELQALVADFGVGQDHIHVRAGGPAAVLPQAAREIHADVMAMGAISRSGLTRAFIGSTAEDVLEHLSCDALIVKPPDFSDALPGWV